MKHCEMIIDYLTDGTDYEYNDNRGILIRCKGCKYNNGWGSCLRENGLPSWIGDNDFCSRAEKKEIDA